MATLQELGLGGNLNVALLARVSTKKLKANKVERTQDVASQFTELQKFCVERGWQWKQYDDAKSGKFDRLEKRRGLVNMLNDLNTHSEIQGVLVTAGDRLARSVEGGMSLVRRILEMNKFIGLVESNTWADKDHWGETEVYLFTLQFMTSEGSNLRHGKDVKRGIGELKDKTLAKGEKWYWGGRARNPKVVALEKEVDTIKNEYRLGTTIRQLAAKYGVSNYAIWKIIRENT